MLSLIYKNWPVYGFVAGILIILILIFTGEKINFTKSLLILQVSFLMFHQFEEYVFPGGFQNFFNEEILNKSLKIKIQLSNSGILIVNVLFGWTFYIISAVIAESALWFSAGIVAITIINGVLHSAAALVKRKYNPGLITGIVFFIPLGVYFFYNIRSDLNFIFILKGAAIAITGCLIIPSMVYLTGRERL